MSSTSGMPPMTVIVAATSSRLGIGLKGALPWRLKKELAYFKRATIFNPENLTNVVVMGRRCWESIPQKFRPLPARHNIVLSRKGRVEGASEGTENVEVASSLANALERVRGRGFGRVFIIGGAEVYREAMTMENCDRILFTDVHGEAETDVDFPVDFRKGGWKQATYEELQEFVGGDVVKGSIIEGDISYEFQMWQRE